MRVELKIKVNRIWEKGEFTRDICGGHLIHGLFSNFFRSQIAASQSTINSPSTSTLTSMNQTTLNRPTSAYFSSNNTSNFMPSQHQQQPTQQNTMPYIISSPQQNQQQVNIIYANNQFVGCLCVCY